MNDSLLANEELCLLGKYDTPTVKGLTQACAECDRLIEKLTEQITSRQPPRRRRSRVLWRPVFLRDSRLQSLSPLRTGLTPEPFPQ